MISTLSVDNTGKVYSHVISDMEINSGPQVERNDLFAGVLVGLGVSGVPAQPEQTIQTIIMLHNLCIINNLSFSSSIFKKNRIRNVFFQNEMSSQGQVNPAGPGNGQNLDSGPTSRIDVPPVSSKELISR